MSESNPPNPNVFSGAHAMQLFDSDESLADAVADFCAEGVLRNETTLAVVREERWYSIAQRLSAKGVAIEDALWRGLLTVRSAERMLKGIMRAGRPHLVTNPGTSSATFLVLQGIGEYDYVPLTNR